MADGSEATSSRAVLAALRALQEKIRRLESERSEAIEESKLYKDQLRELQERSGADALRQAYDRVVDERSALERRLATAQTAAEEAEAKYRDAEQRRLSEVQRASDVERRLRDAERSVSESLAKSAELSARAAAWGNGAAINSAVATDAARAADLETLLEAMVAMSKLLVSDFRAATNGGVPLPPTDAPTSTDVVDNARAALADAKAALDAARTTPPVARVRRRRKATATKPSHVPPPPPHHKRPISRRSVGKPPPPPPRPQPLPKHRRNFKKPDIPWVPSSTNDAISYNLLAACNYALRKVRRSRHVGPPTAIPSAQGIKAKVSSTNSRRKQRR